MAHIFISYSSKNVEERDSLFTFLTTNEWHKFERDDIWYDRSGIRAGDDWADTIDRNLEDAFVVIVVVTKAAMESHYVTYEWSWALGHGIPVVPVIFKPRISLPFWKLKLHSRLEKVIHYFEWMTGNREELAMRLKSMRAESPLARYTGLAIAHEILPAQILMKFVLWAYDYAEPGRDIPSEVINKFLQKAWERMLETYEHRLPRFWMNYSHAFTIKQILKYNELINQLAIFKEEYYVWFNYYSPSIINPDYGMEITKPEMEIFWTNKLEPLFTFFQPQQDSDYKKFCRYLENNDLSNIELQMLRNSLEKHLEKADIDEMWNAIEAVKAHNQKK